MRVLIAPDSFAGTLSAPAAAAAIAAGWREARPGDELDVVGLSDGGPGFVEVMAEALGGEVVSATVRGPFLQPVTASILVHAGTAYVETAQACGLHLVPPDARHPLAESTAGAGDLLLAALAAGPTRVVAGLGGSATDDGGAGMLQALGLALLDGEGEPIGLAAEGLATLARARGRPRWPSGVDLVAAADVDNPLLGAEGATRVFGPQKGASGEDLEVLEAALGRLAAVLGRDLPGAAGRQDLPGAGAAGGLGYAVLVLGGRITSGTRMVLEATGLPARVAAADLVLTGEGSFDEQSLRGKVVAGVAAEAASAGVPCAVLAGRVSFDPGALPLSIAAAVSLVAVAGSPERALEEPELHLGAAARLLAASPAMTFAPRPGAPDRQE